jgi:BolA family transcriptional regulator, general stress-responsive regulator
MNRAERMMGILAKELSPLLLELEDDSARHAGHAGHSPAGETHYKLRVESAAFAGLNKVARHRLVYKLLEAELNSGLHAINIDARAPGEN